MRRLRTLTPAGWLALLLAGFWLTLAAVLLGACTRADAAGTDFADLALEPIDQDDSSVLYRMRWRAGSAPGGAVEAWRTTWTVNGQTVASRELTATEDTQRVARPAPGDSAVVAASVRAVRRGLASVPVTRTAVLRTPDVAPPPPDSVELDTIAVAPPPREGDAIRVVMDTWQWAPSGDSLPVTFTEQNGRRVGRVQPSHAVQFCAALLGRDTAILVLPGQTTDVVSRCLRAVRAEWPALDPLIRQIPPTVDASAARAGVRDA